MSDKTFGVKVSEEVYDRVKNMVEASGVSVKEWFEKAVSLTAVQDLKEGSGDYKQDLSELEMHTTRIYELVANMIQRANFLKDDAVKGLETKLESRDLTITELQGTVKTLNEELKRLREESKQSEINRQALNEQLEGLHAANENNQSLIREYKEKIDTLSSLVNEYRGYASENAEIKASYATEKEQMRAEFGEKENRMTSAIDELKSTVRDQAATIEQYKERFENAAKDHHIQLENQKVNLQNQLSQLTTAKDLEKDRAILEVERIYQEKIQELHEQYNEKLASLYERLEIKDKPVNKGRR